MQAIQVFNNPLFGNVRVIGTEANPLFYNPQNEA